MRVPVANRQVSDPTTAASACDVTHAGVKMTRGACSPWAEGGVVRREGNEICAEAFLAHYDICFSSSVCCV